MCRAMRPSDMTPAARTHGELGKALNCIVASPCSDASPAHDNDAAAVAPTAPADDDQDSDF